MQWLQDVGLLKYFPMRHVVGNFFTIEKQVKIKRSIAELVVSADAPLLCFNVSKPAPCNIDIVSGVAAQYRVVKIGSMHPDGG